MGTQSASTARLEKVRIGIYGAGSVGKALAKAFHSARLCIASIASRTRLHAVQLAECIPTATVQPDLQSVMATSDLVFLTVPDDWIQSVCESVSWKPGLSVIHCSGGLSTNVLASAAESGASTGSFHPLQSFTGASDDWELLARSAIGIEGSGDLLRLLLEIAHRIDATPIHLRAEDKALYHLSAVLISNYTVTLAAIASSLYSSFSVNRDDALRLLMPLLSGTVRNLYTQGIPAALTGPIARGDLVTVQRHLAVLENVNPEAAQLYRLLGQQTIPIAVERGGVDGETAKALESLLQIKADREMHAYNQGERIG